MLSKRNKQGLIEQQANKYKRYTLKKLSVGVASVSIGFGLLFGAVEHVSADEQDDQDGSEDTFSSASDESESANLEIQIDSTHAEEPTEESTSTSETEASIDIQTPATNLMQWDTPAAVDEQPSEALDQVTEHTTAETADLSADTTDETVIPVDSLNNALATTQTDAALRQALVDTLGEVRVQALSVNGVSLRSAVEQLVARQSVAQDTTTHANIIKSAGTPERLRTKMYGASNTLPTGSQLYRPLNEGQSLASGTGFRNVDNPYNYDLSSLAEGDKISSDGFIYNAQGDGAIVKGYLGDSKEVDIPTTFDTKPVTEIGERAFYKKGLTRVTIPDTVVNIGEYAFSENRLNNVVLPSQLNTIDVEGFSQNSLNHITLPKALQSLKAGAFESNRLTHITIPEGVQTIEAQTFRFNRLTSVTMPDSVERIEKFAFSSNSLSTITFPANLQLLGSHAFSTNNFKRVTIPEHVTKIEGNPFPYNPLAILVIKNPDVVVHPNSLDEYSFVIRGQN